MGAVCNKEENVMLHQPTQRLTADSDPQRRVGFLGSASAEQDSDSSSNHHHGVAQVVLSNKRLGIKGRMLGRIPPNYPNA